MDEIPHEIAMQHNPSITDSPYFIIGVILIVIALSIILKMAYSNNPGEYTHKTDE